MEIYDLPGPVWSGSFVCCNFMHELFGKVVQYLMCCPISINLKFSLSRQAI